MAGRVLRKLWPFSYLHVFTSYTIFGICQATYNPHALYTQSLGTRAQQRGAELKTTTRAREQPTAQRGAEHTGRKRPSAEIHPHSSDMAQVQKTKQWKIFCMPEERKWRERESDGVRDRKRWAQLRKQSQIHHMSGERGAVTQQEVPVTNADTREPGDFFIIRLSGNKCINARHFLDLGLRVTYVRGLRRCREWEMGCLLWY